MRGFRTWAVAGLVLAAGMLLTSEARAQQRLTILGHASVAIPTGGLADITGPGPTMGVHMSYPMTPRTAIRITGDLDNLDGARLGSARAPDMKLWRYGIGVERQLLAQQTTAPRTARPAAGARAVARQRPPRWDVVGDLGVGATAFRSKDFNAPGSGTTTRAFRESYFATDAGLTLNYRAGERVRVFAATRGSLSFADEKDTAILASLDPSARARPFGSTVTIPLSAGFAIRM